MKSKKLILIFLISLLLLIMILFYQVGFSQGITRETISPSKLNQLVSDIYRKPQETTSRTLIWKQSPKIPGKCATHIIKMALAHPDWLDEENRFILYRPDNPSYIRYYAPDELVTWTYDTPEGHFKIHYNESGIHAVFDSDDIQSTIPDYVIKFGSYFEHAWDYMTNPNMLGYNPPPPDGNNGGDNRFDVYIKHMDYYGYTNDENGHPYIIVHNNYTGFESNLDPNGSRVGNMKITAAHEFFHAVQYFYVDWLDLDSIWWEENTAVWMEDEVFDEVNGYLNYLGNPFEDLNGNLKWDSGEPWYDYNDNLVDIHERENDVWFEAPHISLDTRSTTIFTRYEYGGVIWAKYLAAIFGDEFIKDSFIITDYDTVALIAIQQALLDYGSSLEETFTDFRVRVLTLDPNIFEEAEQYPLIRHVGNYGDYPVSLDLGDISHLSCRYIGLKPPSGEKKLVIDVDGQDYSNFGVVLVLFTDTGHEVRDIPIEYQDEQVGRIEVISFGTEGLYKRATIIPMNLSTGQNYRSIDIYAHLEGIMKYTLRLKGGINLTSLPTNLPGASNSYNFLLNYFDPNIGVQFSGYDPFSHTWQISYFENQPKGALFPIDWQKGYVISVPKDMNIDLSGDPPTRTTIDLVPGHNLISSLISDGATLSPKDVLESTNSDSGEHISASIHKYDHEEGKRRCGYWFFGRFTSEDFEIEEGEGYMVDMVEERKDWSPP